MHRIDGPGAVNNLFSAGDPTVPQMATVVTPEWLNDVQENIARVILAAGITLVKGDYDQLRQALAILSGSGLVGEVIPWFADELPASGDWLKAQGLQLPKLDYPLLFDVWGYTYGGEGALFGTPKLNGIFLRGVDDGAGVDLDTDIRTNRGDGVTGDRVGTKQTSATLDHVHGLFVGNPGTGVGSENGGFGTAYAGSGTVQSTAGLLSQTEGGMFMTGANSGWHRNQISRYETRPVNIAVQYIFRWR
ncbi:hypothetical protein NNJEOMEG_02255 [Fundidesulfovibrio magnetotacticus]|uniref:Phage tail collar domain-containing protein n=1 Tax=Fundidesulfovibrio magnetotacticus TaxID=2730080 RepID=A0A6V8LTZ3_9BACT|nr:tail fiber protein [Fundidesulfovibrio magnetotacticus]GFK94410.1 hypothetical protein NNJEOMEG_02255 [Fundidesulfovibrio magnetotacticus]